jgi:uncharacterized protein YndB with AHSA1/START domain
MVRHSFALEIKAPMEKVFAYVTDFRKNAEWQDGVKESTQTPDGPTQLGTKIRTVRTFLGQQLEGSGEVIEFVPNQKMTFKTTSGPIQAKIAQMFEPTPDGTRVTTDMEMEPKGFFKVAEGALAGNLKQTMESQAARLKSILES